MATPFELPLWQKKQVTLLYHFASLSYLNGLLERVQDLNDFADSALETANVQQRDQVLYSKPGGERCTSKNWANSARRHLANFQSSVVNDVGNRAFEIYAMTDAMNCARRMAEFSMQWTTPEEQAIFDSKFQDIALYALNIDYTLNKSGRANRWCDFGLTLAWERQKNAIARLPQLRARPEIEGASGEIPVRTGVYIPQDDPNGSPQFAWAGGEGGQLLECATLNDLGLMALADVGRDDLWLSSEKMYAFVQANIDSTHLISDPFFEGGTQEPPLAASLVARNCFTSRPCKWHYVEIIDGGFDFR